MLKINFIRNNKEEILEGLDKRYFQEKKLINEILLLDYNKKKIKKNINNLLERSNRISKIISNYLIYKKFKIKINNLIQNSTNIKKKIKELNKELLKINNNLKEKIILIPNIPDKKVKKGKNYKENEEIYRSDNIPLIKNKLLHHSELAKKFKILNFEIGVKISGSGFPIYIGKGALLQRGLIKYCLDKNIQAGYKEYILPYLINEYSGYATGQIPDKECQMYSIEKDKLYLIPTGEVPLLNCYRDNLFLYKDLPIKSTTYTSCFRREAGSYGLNNRGLNRIHQFDKVEIIQITNSENSYNALEEMVKHVKELLKSLDLPFRIIRLCGGEMGFTSAMTYDFEVYNLAQKKWLEVSSISNCLNFQSYRLNLRYRTYEGKIYLCHTLNGSSLALSRIFSTLIENNQKEESISIPEILIPYVGFDTI